MQGEEKLYAVKVLKKMMVLESEELEHTRTERAILKDMRHPFLVRMYFSFQVTQPKGGVPEPGCWLN